MKVLWVTHSPVGKCGELIAGNSSQSGNWVDATAEKLLYENKNVILGIATATLNDCKIEDNGITYFGVGGIKKYMGKKPNSTDKALWRNVIEEFNPDVIVVWGTEFSLGESIVEAAGEIPVLFYIQGVLGVIAHYKYGLLKTNEITKRMGIEKLKIFFNWKNQKQMERQKKIEISMLQKSAGIIVDNEWAASYYRAVIPTIKVYKHSLVINNAFKTNTYVGDWKNTIFTIAGTGPHKGLHILIEALKIVSSVIPDVRLIIPGNMTYKNPTMVFQPLYVSYIKKQIERYGLEKNIVFTGRLDSTEMYNNIKHCSVFVMPSCIENHSSSLREAMVVGAPCISALVGSVGEFLMHDKNGLLYRYEEAFSLASQIIRVLSDRELAETLGENATHIEQKYPREGNGKVLYRIFEKVIFEDNDD